MLNGKQVLAYIPARSGSKSIPDKNIARVAGKPLIAYTIETAKKSKYVDRLVVSTDSPDYEEIAKQYGAEVPFLRPLPLATDEAIEMDTTLHLINWMEENSDKFDIIMRLQATSPLRTTEDIDRAIEQLVSKDADSIISVNKCPVSPLWMNTLPEDHSMKDFLSSEIKTKRRQDLPKYYQLNGAVFIAKWDVIKQTKSWFGNNTYAMIIPRERSIDIDDQFDLKIVRLLLEEK